MKVFTFLITAAVALGATTAGAQQPPTQSAAAPIVPSVPSAIPVGSRVGELPTGYEDGGRRDPFGALVQPRRVAAAPGSGSAARRTGLSGLALADVNVRGILRSGTTMLAILEGPSNQSYVTRTKDRLVDAVVVSIDAEGVVFSEQMDGTAAVSQVRKSLRPAGEGVR